MPILIFCPSSSVIVRLHCDDACIQQIQAQNEKWLAAKHRKPSFGRYVFAPTFRQLETMIFFNIINGPEVPRDEYVTVYESIIYQSQRRRCDFE